MNRNSTYIVSELDSSVFDCPITAFRVIPYFAHQRIDIPPLDKLIDISACRLRELEDSTAADPDDDSDDLADEEDSPLDSPDGNEDRGQSSFQLGGETYTIAISLFISDISLDVYFHFHD